MRNVVYLEETQADGPVPCRGHNFHPDPFYRKPVFHLVITHGSETVKIFFT